MDHLWSPWRYRYLTSAEKPLHCIFCVMAAEDHDEANLIVHRGVRNFIVLNKFPYTSGHLMVVPYAHAGRLSGVDSDTASEMMRLTRLAEERLWSLYRPTGMNVGMNIGESAGAGVAGHIHMHVLPRWQADANFMTTIGETRMLPEELSVTWRRVRDVLSSEEPHAS